MTVKHEEKDAARNFDEIVHGMRFTAFFTKAEYEVACAVLDELSMLRRFKNNALRLAQCIIEEGDRVKHGGVTV